MEQRKDKCIHKWKYYKVIKKRLDFVDNITRECVRCSLKEFVRRLRLNECKKVGVFDT